MSSDDYKSSLDSISKRLDQLKKTREEGLIEVAKKESQLELFKKQLTDYDVSNLDEAKSKVSSMEESIVASIEVLIQQLDEIESKVSAFK